MCSSIKLFINLFPMSSDYNHHFLITVIFVAIVICPDSTVTATSWMINKFSILFEMHRFALQHMQKKEKKKLRRSVSAIGHDWNNQDRVSNIYKSWIVFWMRKKNINLKNKRLKYLYLRSLGDRESWYVDSDFTYFLAKL